MTAQRKPRIALMGEFSAGKSTLSNLLLGARPLPEKVTATRLSPVWMSHGTDAPYRVDVDGSTEPVSIDQLINVPVHETRVIRLFLESDILDVCDLIDFPGISDPNMSSTVWERVLTEVDAVIWCTHATQAWRQSESAVWDTIPQLVRDNSILLITRFDKLTTENDRRRVLKRVMRETKGQFAGTFPISLIQALQAGDDPDKWDASGAGPFVNHLIDMIQRLSELAARTPEGLYNYANVTQLPAPVMAPVTPRRVMRPTESDQTAKPRLPANTAAFTDPIIRSS
ncbi:dynamin family protein [Yoonia sp.]|uniref:dynamin family protein n=1 Tax=Yoonia sp. TaxID=2212373 RepID=UPI0025ED5119|nr:dynamin family protein [Yoonia sp.]